MKDHNQILAGVKVVDHRRGHTAGVIQQVETLSGIDIKAWMSKWLIPAIILQVGLYQSLMFVLNRFVIESDSLREYNTYLFYVKQGYWSPIPDNILSSSLWTTYLPALIQRIIQLDNPEVVYRVVLGVLIAPLPLMIYLLAKKYVSSLIAVMMTLILYTSFYYQGFADFARTQVAIIMAIALLLAILRKGRTDYFFISLSAIALVFAHYLAAYIYAGVLGLAWLMVDLRYWVWHQWTQYGRSLRLGAIVLILVSLIFYTVVVPSVSHYAGIAAATISQGFNAGVFAELRPDFVLTHLFLLGRVGIAAIVLGVLWYKGKIWSLPSVFYALGAGVTLIVLFAPALNEMVGLLRPSYILLPVELIGIAYWWGKRGKDWRLAVLLGIWSLVSR